VRATYDTFLLDQRASASVLGRVASGPRAGQLVMRPTAPLVTTAGPRHADLEGFDLHANVAPPAQLFNWTRFFPESPPPPTW
jgi:hypothetical protein